MLKGIKKKTSIIKKKKTKQANKQKPIFKYRYVASELWDGTCCPLQPSRTLLTVFTPPQGDKAWWSLSCTRQLALRNTRAPEGGSTPLHVFLNPTPSTEDVI